MSLRAGAAIRDVSPRKPLFLCGYPHVPRISTGIHDSLFASALYLENEGIALFFIALDIIEVTHGMVAACRCAIREKTGVPEEHILISATHTHSGPNTIELLAWRHDPTVSKPDPEYMGQLREGIVEAAVAAQASVRPAELAITAATAQGVGGNRLSREGIHDPEVGLLCVRDQREKKLFGLALVYGMHPTVLHEDSKLVSSDFPHAARFHLQERFPGLIVAYHLSPCGNLSPRYHVRGQTFAEAERLGRKLGQNVLEALDALRETSFTDQVSLAARQGYVELPVRKFLTVPEAEQKLSEARSCYDQLKRAGAEHGVVRTAECAVFGAEEAVVFAQAQVDGSVATTRRDYTPTEVQVLRVGDTFWVGLPGELFVEYGLEIKRSAPGRAFVISLANGELQGYIVTPEADAAGGYEAANSFFESAAGAKLVKTALELMRGMTL